MENKVSVIGAAIIDILAGPADASVFETGSMPMDTIRMSFGGDALNESVVMSKLGLPVEIITKVGGDDAGRKVISYLEEQGVSCKAVVDDTIETGVNIVLVDKDGQRSFLTNPHSSLRKLSENDISDRLEEMGDIVCFASMFVSPAMDIAAMERIFAKIKSMPGRKLVVDMTTAKNGETLADIKCLLGYIDYLIPNETEAKKLTGIDDPYENAKLMVEAGAGCVIIKCGSRGCLAVTANNVIEVPVCGHNVVDTTGAGDSFVAGFVWGLNNGFELKESCEFGCAVSSVIIEEYGANNGIKSIDEPMKRYRECYERT